MFPLRRNNRQLVEGKHITTVEPVYNGHNWDHAKWLLYRGGLLIALGWWCIRIILVDGFNPTGWCIEGDLPNQVAVSTGSTVAGDMCFPWGETPDEL